MAQPIALNRKKPTRRRVLLVITPIEEESATRMLKGIAHFQRLHQPWETLWDYEALSLKDPGWFTEGRWDGVISRHTNEFQVQECRRLGIPLVDVNDCTPFPGVPNIRLDNRSVGSVGARHFLDRGFTALGFCGFGNELWARERRDGFVEEVAAAGQSCSIFDTPYKGNPTPEWQAHETQELIQWLRDLPKPAAVMACNDLRALLVMQAADAAGLKIPDDIAVLGANDDEVRCELAHPPLSSVATGHFQSGYLAAETLMHLMDDQGLEGQQLSITATEVVPRPSTDILAISDKRVVQAVRFIHQNACNGVTVEAVTRHAGMSRTQLEQRFRHFFGRSPQAEIRKVVLARIRQLLVDTDLPLKAIAELTGFAHTEYLSVFFKREMGESPGRFRKRPHG